MRTFCSFLALLAFVGADAHAHAQRTPYDREVTRLASEVRRAGSSPRAVVPLLEMDGYANFATPGFTRRELGRLANERRLSPSTRVLASAQEAFGMLGTGEYSRAVERIAGLGFLTNFRFVGGFDDEGKQGFVRVYPPEEQRNAPVAADAEYPGRLRTVRWRDYPAELGRYGFVDFDATTRPYENSCVYAETFVQLDRARPMSLWAGVGGAYKIWVNGDEVLADSVYRRPTIDRSAAIFQGREGHNRILVKVCVQEGRWGMYLRLGEADGSPPRNVVVDANGAQQASAPAASYPPLPAAPAAPLESLSARVEASEDDAAARFDLARYLAWTGSEEPTDRRSRQLAERAAELQPSVDHLLYAAELAETRAETMRFVAKAEESFGRDPRVKLARIELIAGGPDAGRALRMLESFNMTTTVGLDAAWLRATMLEERSLNEAGLAVVREAVRRTGNSLRWRLRLATALGMHGHVEAAWDVKRAVLADAQDDTSLRFEFMNDAYERDAHDEVFAHLDQLRALDPTDQRTIEYAASVYEGLGRVDDALDLYRQIIAYAPDEAGHHAQLGRALLRMGNQGAAVDAFRQALVLRPQDADTRQLLDRLQPRDREDERWATPTEQLLARRHEETEWHSTTLQELQVVTVFESGLASSFNQVAFQVHDDEGARTMRRFPITYEPGRQWVEIRSAKVHRRDGTVVDVTSTSEQQLGDSRYRIYYDTRALLINMPQLRPGDMVEIRYRVEDVSRRNMFNDYYGDVRYLQGSEPKMSVEHVLITPNSRQFYFNRPALPGLERTQERRGDNTVHRFVATNVPPVRSEPGMPGPAETRPFLHVSTYRSWEDVGRWWWGLAQDQLVPDESLIRTTRELVAGAANDREKVTRIYDWVIRNTRYVGLEFGIHGFKPYRVTQIVSRGFGDCKDKASLIYAMLTIAGIDARIALIRTTRNGAIAHEPASLAIFDHAIAYVPQFDLFLDGTAEMNGTTELPAMDQGTVTLLVGPESAELRTTPIIPASRSVRTRSLNITLARSGSATVRAQEVVTGDNASRYRSTYQAEARRTERLQRELAGAFSGIELTSQSFRHLDEYERAPEYEWEGTVPQFAETNGNRLLVAPASISNLTRAYAPAPTRRHALELGPPGRLIETRSIRIPAGTTLEALPAGGQVRSEFGSLSINYTRRGNDVVVRTEWELSANRVEVDDYPAFRRFIQEQDVLLRQRVTFGGAQ